MEVARTTVTDYQIVRFFHEATKYFHIAAFAKDADSPTFFYVLVYSIFCIKIVVYVSIILNVLKPLQTQHSESSFADSLLRFLYGFNFHLFFIPVTDTLSSVYKCVGVNQISPSRSYGVCKMSDASINGYLAACTFVLAIKIFINISHEVCDTEKRIKLAKPWSK